MTTMDRLFKKHLLSRRKVGQAFVYRRSRRARKSKKPSPPSSSRACCGATPTNRSRSSRRSWMRSRRDRSLLDELERLVREKRRAIDRRRRNQMIASAICCTASPSQWRGSASSTSPAPRSSWSRRGAPAVTGPRSRRHSGSDCACCRPPRRSRSSAHCSRRWYWRYEPRTVEDLDVTLTVVAVAALALIGASALRGYTAWRRATRRSRAWLRVARSLHVDASIPAYEVPAGTPMMALVGVFRLACS